jgi:hypothetical protein
MRYKIIKVTLKDIEAGIRASAYGCPVARAVKRAFPKARYVSWGIFSGMASDVAGYWELTPVSKRPRKFVDAFDSGKKVKPISCKVRITRVRRRQR